MVRADTKIKKAQEEGRIFFSFEYFPPKTENGLTNLYDRMDRMSEYIPEWVDVTWGAGGSTSDLTLEICTNSQKYMGMETMMHVTCTNVQPEKVKSSLQAAKNNGIENILALRGDPPAGQTKWEAVDGGFNHAVDLVRFVRKEFGEHFGICVAGYPEGHPDGESYELDLKYLKEKVDAGANMIITQLFYSTELFLKFVKDCREIGINIPIIPGMMPIQSYGGFKRMVGFCKTFVPQEILDALEPIKDNDEAVKAYGIELCTKMCKDLIAAGTPGLHFYTLNLEKSCTTIIQNLGLVEKTSLRRSLPWRSSALSSRNGEDVRPIFWANRPKSYVARTSEWDEYPNGRWGSSRSPAFGDISSWHGASDIAGFKIETCRDEWGQPLSEQDVFDVFAKFCEGKINKLPWCAELAPETRVITTGLLDLNKAGYLTINSQPALNGVDSSHTVHGWGGANGFVFQKAYIELFASPAQKDKLIKRVTEKYPMVTFNAVNSKGDFETNSPSPVTAVTWGVFPGSEIKQPTVVDTDSFLVWKDEAFTLWNSWKNLYAADAPSAKLIENIQSNYWLICLVDNDFIHGNIFDIFKEDGDSAEMKAI